MGTTNVDTLAAAVEASSLKLSGTAITATAAEVNTVAGVTAGAAITRRRSPARQSAR